MILVGARCDRETLMCVTTEGTSPALGRAPTSSLTSQRGVWFKVHRHGKEYCVCSTCKCSDSSKSDSTKPDSTTKVRQGAFKYSEWIPNPSWKQWKSEPFGFHKLQVILWMSCIPDYFWLLQRLHNLSCIKEPRDRKHLFCSPLHPFHKDCSKFSFCSNPIQFHSPLVRTNTLIIWLTSKNWKELRPSNLSVSSTGWSDFWLLSSHVNGSCLKVTIYGC